MLDATIRKRMEPPLAVIARLAMKWRISALTATVIGFVLGLVAVALIVAQLYALAAVALLVSRFFDALDGAIARQSRMTSLGSFLDTVLDFILYATVVFAFALADPAANALAAAFLAGSLMGPATSFFVYGIVAFDNGVTRAAPDSTILSFLDGLTEGTETIVCLTLMCIFPAWFSTIAVIFAVLCWISTGARIAHAVNTFAANDRRDAEIVR